MNFALNIACNVEQRLPRIERHEGWTDEDESRASEEILQQVIKEDGLAWAGGDIRIGEIILIVDSDTRIPRDCLFDAATEFREFPDVAILQHKSGFIRITHNYWERWVINFNEFIYAFIDYAATSDSIRPFLGYHRLITCR